MRVLDLFSGIGGFSLGLERAGMETIAFCENDKKARLVLKKHWPHVPIFEDVRELNAGKLKELYPIDLICGGFPCQPFSVAGKRKGTEDDRHLWPEYFRLIQEVRPRWVLGENVAGLINMGLDRVLSDLEGEGYTCQTLVIPACAVNAPHRRDRVWIVANARQYIWRDGISKSIKGNGKGGQDEAVRANQATTTARSGEGAHTVAHADNSRSNPLQPGRVKNGTEINKRWEGQPFLEFGGHGTENVANVEIKRMEGRGAIGKQEPQIPLGKTVSGCNGSGNRANHWKIEPDVGRVAHGVPRRVDRLKQLGNAVVPQIVEIIGRAIMEKNNAK